MEQAISALLRDRFSFMVIPVQSATERAKLEKRLIGTVAGCGLCSSSPEWLGRHSPKMKIARGNLWQVQHLKADPLGPTDKEAVLRAINTARARGHD